MSFPRAGGRSLNDEPTLEGHSFRAWVIVLAALWQLVSAVTAWLQGGVAQGGLCLLGSLLCLGALGLHLTGVNLDHLIQRQIVSLSAIWFGLQTLVSLRQGAMSFHNAAALLVISSLAFALWPWRMGLALSLGGFALHALASLLLHHLDFSLLSGLLFLMALTAYLSIYSQHMQQAVRRASQAEQMLVRDGVTGLLTRDGAMLQIGQLLKETALEREHVALGLLQLEGLGQINRQFGHGSGDRTLQLVSIVLIRQGGPQDLAVRWGGARFLVVYKNANRIEARGRLNHLLDTLNAEAWPGGPRMRVRAVLGMLGCEEALPTAVEKLEQELTLASPEATEKKAVPERSPGETS